MYDKMREELFEYAQIDVEQYLAIYEELKEYKRFDGLVGTLKDIIETCDLAEYSDMVNDYSKDNFDFFDDYEIYYFTDDCYIIEVNYDIVIDDLLEIYDSLYEIYDNQVEMIYNDKIKGELQ